MKVQRSGEDSITGSVEHCNAASSSLKPESRDPRAKEMWSAATKKVGLELHVSKKFMTLRDMTGMNEIKPEQLKRVRTLGACLSVFPAFE